MLNGSLQRRVVNSRLFIGQPGNHSHQQNHHQYADHCPNPHRSAHPTTHPSVCMIHHDALLSLLEAALNASCFRLRGVLQSSTHALGITERCALASSSPTVRCHCRHSNLGRTTPSIRPDMIFGKDSHKVALAYDLIFVAHHLALKSAIACSWVAL